jgi:hypothetical protein
MDEWLDCLDFAPDGVLDLVKKLSVDLPLSDYNKRQALKEKLGFDVDKAITNLTAEQAENKKESKPVRRTETASGRRTSGINKYKVIKKDE